MDNHDQHFKCAAGRTQPVNYCNYLNSSDAYKFCTSKIMKRRLQQIFLYAKQIPYKPCKSVDGLNVFFK